MFGQFYSATQGGSVDIQNLVNHKTREAPPSLFKNRDIHGGKKSCVLACLVSRSTSTKLQPDVATIIMEGSVLLSIMRPKNGNTFFEYAEKVFSSCKNKIKKSEWR